MDSLKALLVYNGEILELNAVSYTGLACNLVALKDSARGDCSSFGGAVDKQLSPQSYKAKLTSCFAIGLFSVEFMQYQVKLG